MEKLKKGDTVMIYQDPITTLKEEGEAILLNKAYNEGHIDKYWCLERWIVRFISDNYTTQRTIKVRSE